MGKEKAERPVGRPSDYKPEYCKLIIELGKQGFSKVQMAAELDVAKSTIQEWEKAHPEFSVALTRAMTHSQAWWEKKGQDCLVMPGGVKFEASAWSRSMAARFPDDWREKSETTLSNPDGSGLSFVIGRHESKNAKD